MEQISVKASFTAGEAGQIAGYASLFGRPADLVGDVVERGAFKASLAMGKPAMLAEHKGVVVGTWEEVVEDDMGLRVKGRFDLTSDAGRAAYAEVIAGRKDGLSIGYFARQATKSGSTRHLQQIDLVEISVVREPASNRARILNVKSKEGTMPDNEQGAAPEIAALETRLAAAETAVKGIKTPDISPLETRLAELEKKANRPGGQPDEKAQAELESKALRELLKNGSFGEHKAAVSTVDPQGGWFVLPTIDTTIRDMLLDISPMRQLAEVVTISTATYERFFSKGNRGAAWVYETTTRPQDTARPELIKHEYQVAEMYAAPAATRQLLEDASIDIAGWFSRWTANDFSVTEGEAFLSGDGTGGKPRGLTTYTRVATADATRAWGEMQYVPGGHATAPTDENWTDALITIVLTLHNRFRLGSSWLMNTATLLRIKKIKDTNKRLMWGPDGHLNDSPERLTLLGYPVYIDENMPDIGENTFPIAFGNFRDGYTIIDRQGIRVVRDEVTSKGNTLFDTYKRVGGGLGDSRAIKWIKIATS